MAKKTQKAEAPAEAATPVTTTDVVNAILDYNRSVIARLGTQEMAPLVWPCLIGPSGCGKTTLMHAIAQGRKRHLDTLLLGTMQPEEVGGAPRAVEVDGQEHTGFFKWFLPSFAFRGEGMLFMDEMDKADRAHWATVLTLCTSLKIRDHSIRDSEIVAAMQPVTREEFLADETGKALSARLCFLPMHISDSLGYLGRKYGGVALDWFSTGEQNVDDLPVNLSPRGIDWILGFSQWLSAHNPEQRLSILRVAATGMALPDQVTALLDSIKAVEEVSPDSMVEALLRDPERVAKLPLATVQLVLPYVWSNKNSTLPLLEAVMTRFLSECPIEQIGEVQNNLVQHLTQLCEANPAGRWIDVFGGATEEQVSEVIARASQNACKYRLKEIEEAKKVKAAKAGGK